MHKLSITCLALAASFAPAFAQAPAAALPTSLRVRITSPDVNSGRTSDMFILQGKSKNVVTISPRPDGSEPQDIAVSKCTAFYIMQPNELKRAQEFYQDQKIGDARKAAALTKRKYAMSLPLANNPATSAALLEIESAVRLQDWAGVKELVASFPLRPALPTDQALSVDIAELLGMLTDQKWANVITKAKPLLEKEKNMTLKQLAQLHYALGTAEAKQFDPAGLSSTDPTVLKEAEMRYNKILDHFALTIVAEHNASPELVGAAIIDSLELYSKSPKLQAYVKQIGAVPVSTKIAAAAPQALKDAAGLYHLYTSILFPKKTLDAKFNVYGKFFKNPLDRTKNPPAAPDKADAPAAPATPAPAEKKS